MRFKILISVAIAIQTTAAVFTDEAYRIDWSVESLGVISSIQYDDDRAITASSQFISGLDRKTGDLIWRKPSRRNTTNVVRIDKISESAYAVGDGQYVSLYDKNGALVNEFLMPSSAEASAVMASKGKQALFIALNDRSVYKYDTMMLTGSLISSLPTGVVVGSFDSGFVLDKDGSLYTVKISQDAAEKPVLLGKGKLIYSQDNDIIWVDSSNNIMVNSQTTVLKMSDSLVLDVSNRALVEVHDDADETITLSLDTGLVKNKEPSGNRLDFLSITSDGLEFANQSTKRLKRDELDIADVLFLEQDEEQVQNELVFEENAGILPGFFARVRRHISERPSVLSSSSSTDVDRLFANKVIVFVSKNDILRATDINGNLLWQIDSIEGPFRAGIDNRIHTKTHIIDAEGHCDPQATTLEIKYDYGYNDTSIYGLFGSPTWSLSIPGFKVAAVSEREVDDISASIGIILPDRRVLYKYLHKGSIAAAFVSPTGEARVILLDKVTGRILGEKIHDHVHEQSLRLVFGEYWIAYTFDSDTGTQLAVWDLLESRSSNVRTFSEGNYSSFDSFPAPEIDAKAVFLPESVSALGVSKTRFGISSRDILIAFKNGQILALPKSVLDTSTDNVLQLDPYHVITHNRHILVTNIKTSGTLLESTSVIVGFGKDVFVTRITPSQPFDMLTASFSKQGLINTIIILISGVLVLRPFVKKRALKVNWQ